MVYFECGRCNETFKKPKVAKHLASCGSQRVSCIDCLTSFMPGEWENHVTCISEAEKYQGKLYEGKNKVPKGQQKQCAWTECVQNAKEGSPSNLKHYFEKLQTFDNVPRKYNAFVNFMKNSVRIYDNKAVEAIWAAIQKCQETTRAVAPATEKLPSDQPQRKRWAGWEEEAKDLLQRNNGEMPWKRICTELSGRYTFVMSNGAVKKRSEEEIALTALASLPERWLSSEDNFVRLR
eukprot:GEMP01056681.1.p1 GENE.GEMP01056681.1~~GEMP01056681.1.p1  ORF type:complete len:244 (-),score=54.63 GEMP01056681.1:771-1475(-)